MRRLPPQQAEENLANLLDIAPHLTEELLSSIDQPLKVQTCAQSGKEYLVCDYNRDGDSYRSPWSNQYDPLLEDGNVPSARLRELEVTANEAFDTYRDQYFEGGVSSVYFWDLDDGFAGAILIKKVNDSTKLMKGAWDSIHVIEVIEKGRYAQYKLTSTVMLYTITSREELGSMNLSGNMTRQEEKDCQVADPSDHIANIGRMVEDMEIKMRNSLQEVYFGKTKDVVNELRAIGSLDESRKQAAIHQELFNKLNLRKADVDGSPKLYVSLTGLSSRLASKKVATSIPTDDNVETSPSPRRKVGRPKGAKTKHRGIRFMMGKYRRRSRDSSVCKTLGVKVFESSMSVMEPSDSHVPLETDNADLTAVGGMACDWQDLRVSEKYARSRTKSERRNSQAPSPVSTPHRKAQVARGASKLRQATTAGDIPEYSSTDELYDDDGVACQPRNTPHDSILTGKEMFALRRLRCRIPTTPKSVPKSSSKDTPQRMVDTPTASTPTGTRRRGKQSTVTPATPSVSDRYNLNELDADMDEIEQMSNGAGFFMHFGRDSDGDDDDDNPLGNSLATLKDPTASTTQDPEYQAESSAAQGGSGGTYEKYFQGLHDHRMGNTSNHTLSRLPVLEHEEFLQLLKSTPASHKEEREALANLHAQHFPQWLFELRNGFNILFYGLGSKRQLLTKFVLEYLQDSPVVVVNGFFPTLTVRHIFQKIIHDVLQLGNAGANPHEQIAVIRRYFGDPDRAVPEIYLVIHNIDGTSLRPERTQQVLGHLASCSPHVHIIASVDHIQVPVLWDSVRLAQFQWVWHDLTTFDYYQVETSFENSLLVQRQEISAVGIQYVLASLTSNAKGVFRVLASHQIEQSDPKDASLGLDYSAFYQRCRERFLVSSDTAFRAQLTEFRDHKIIHTKRGADGVEILHIPLDQDILQDILETMS
ncbi:F-actin-capping protein subunit beta [Dispira parvispora]|uniref:F-actin-capping protein subunit beta n=1 Tax=Dispira parvispora TaxID=1520584 RepID=A0A9W8B0Y5_9FUNG|nr:F-actin-capping protein subunit beta [Dispira parvispora]